MDTDQLIIVHDTNSIENALYILKSGIIPSSLTNRVNWNKDPEICLSGIDMFEILQHNLMWGYIRFILKNSWVKQNAKVHFKQHFSNIMLEDEELWSNFITLYSIKTYIGPIHSALNQLVCDIPVPPFACECVIYYFNNSSEDHEREFKTLKEKIPSGIKLYVVRKYLSHELELIPK